MPEENANTVPLLSDIDVTLLSEEELSRLRDVFERQWVLHEINAKRKRKLEQEIKELEEKIDQRSRSLHRKNIAQSCNICLKAKVASISALVCESCSKKTCPRCGKRDEGKWRCDLCLKKRASLILTGAWYCDVELCERFQVQVMLNKIAEEFVRRTEVATCRRRDEPAVRVSSPPYEPPSLCNAPSLTQRNQQPQNTLKYTQSQTRLHVKRYQGGDDDSDADGDDDDVFEEDNSEQPMYSDEYLSFPHPEEQSQGETSGSSFILSSSVDEETFGDESQDASGYEHSCTPTDYHQLENQTTQRKIAVSTMPNNQGVCPIIQMVSLRKSTPFYGGSGSGSEFGIKVVGGRMCTGGFNGVYVAKVTGDSTAEKCIKEGDQILEWNHRSMVDVSFEQVRSIIADSPEEVNLVVCHNTTSFKLSRQHSRETMETTLHQQAKTRESFTGWSRWSLSQFMTNDFTSEEGENKIQAERNRGQILLQLWHDPNGNNIIVRVIGAKSLSLQDKPNQLPNPYVLIYLLPNREISSRFQTNTDPQTVTPKWDLSFIFSNIPNDELSLRTLEVTLWSEDHARSHAFLGEVLISLTPGLLQSGAQCMWYDFVDHDDSSFSFPVPMPRRHSLSEPVLEQEGKTRVETAANVRTYSRYGRNVSARSVSSIDLSPRRDSHVCSENSPPDLTLHHTKQRRAVVKEDNLCPRSEFRDVGIVERKKKDNKKKHQGGKKWNSAPCTPAMSAQVSTEDLRERKSSFPTMHKMLTTPAFTLSEFLSKNQLPEAKPVEEELEPKHEEKEGKVKGALRVIKRCPGNLRIRLGKLAERNHTRGVDEETGACGPLSPFCLGVPIGYNSAPTTPSRSTSTENLARERSRTTYSDYLQVPPSPGIFTRQISKRLSGEVPQSPFVTRPNEGHFFFNPGGKKRASSISPRRSPEPLQTPIPEVREKPELQFSYPGTKTCDEAEQESSLEESSQHGVTEKENFVKEEEQSHADDDVSQFNPGLEDVGIDVDFDIDGENQESAVASKKSSIASIQSQPKMMIPRIAIHRSSSPIGLSQFNPEQNEPVTTKPSVETQEEQKGAIRALRKYSKQLRPRLSLKPQDKLCLYGEDPVKGAIGPGQIRRGSCQGNELGFIRIGLSALHDTFEVEIIRAVALLVPGDQLPDTYVKTYLIKDQGSRLLKRKTSITRRSAAPVYNCKIKYPLREIHNQELLVSVWCKQGIFGRKVLLGEVHIALGSLNLSIKQVAWYKLFIDCHLSDGD